MRTLKTRSKLFLAIWAFALSLAYGLESPHETLNFECGECHTADSWKEMAFDHQKTGFSLDGRHAVIRCRSCHDIATFGTSGSDCNSCHVDIHQGKLSGPCSRCHTAESWALFDSQKAHAGTSFPLLGVHSRLDCKSCHTSEIVGEYSFAKSECISCHIADYEQTTNPSHVAMSMGTRCEECHNPVTWIPANFGRHDSFFPISSGSHAGKWSSCLDCHPDTRDYAVFSCLGCHEHSRSRMDSSHDEVNGYLYDSNACYNCHPRGRGGD